MRTHFCNPEPYREEWGRRRHQAGIGLLGAILLALAIAVAAIALSAYHAPRKEDDGGLKRSIAVMGAATIIDALRADRSAALDGAFNLAPDATVDARRSGSAEASEDNTLNKNSYYSNPITLTVYKQKNALVGGYGLGLRSR